MAIDWSAVKAVKIPEGDCKRVAINGTVVWEKGLPSEYQQVEYIQSDGLQAIDTGVYPLVGTSITLDFAKTQMSTSDGLMGARSNNTFAIYLYVTGHNVNQQHHSCRGAVAYGRVNSYVTDINFYNNTDKHTVTAEYTKGGVTAISDGATTSLGPSTVPSNLAWYLFACNSNDSVDTGHSAKIKMYACEISQNGETIRDFVPCYRKSDGEIGMYDLVNGVFYTNAGSGTFIKGEDV